MFNGGFAQGRGKPIYSSGVRTGCQWTTGYLEQEIRCHTSLVPFRVQTAVSGNKFALTNLTVAPFQIERSEGVAFEGTNATAIRGTFRQGAFIRLKNHGEIRLKQSDK